MISLRMYQLLLSIVFIFCLAVADAGYHSLSDEYINEINSKQSLWKAGRNFGPDTSLTYLRSLLGVKKLSTSEILRDRNFINDLKFMDDVPENFDAREHWPQCASLKRIYDQASCGSCWAVSTASAMTDRLCIASNGTDQRPISANNLMSCCGLSKPSCGVGCDGGNPFAAWIYWESNGIATGGPYNTSEGCQSYPFPSCKHHTKLSGIPNCSEQINTNPECKHVCDNPDMDYSKELTFGTRSHLINTDIKNAPLMEIFTYGPIIATFAVFDDFFNYKTGIYKRSSETWIGDHAVRVLGWGVENNISYWLVANSWNDQWGDHGLFKILRDHDECEFESSMTAGIPKI